MINTRQRNIISDLIKSKKTITAKTLAEKYSCSLRTIRNDIKEIGLYLTDTDAKLISLPGKGLKIISDRPIAFSKDAEYTNAFFISYEKEIKFLLLIMIFQFQKNPLTLEYLASQFDASKGTISNVIQEFNAEMGKKGISIKGIKNKGYFISTTNSSLIKYHQKITSSIDSDILVRTIFNHSNNLMNENETNFVQDILDFIENRLFLLINDKSSLTYIISIVLFGNDNHVWSDKKNTSLHSEPKFIQLKTFIQKILEIEINNYQSTLLYHALCNFTDFNEIIEKPEINDKFNLAVKEMIESMMKYHPELKEEKENLYFDLIRHLKTQVTSKNLKLEDKNPLLTQIKARYPDIFDELKKYGVPSFNKFYKIKFTDDDIGYLTLYFCKSLEKIKKIKDAKVLVVCNTGRGASKLLVTRIMNNCPEIHVVAMASSFDLGKNSELLDNIDLVISTIALPEINKPYVIVSPILQDFELIKIREAIYLGKQNYTRMIDKELNHTVDNLVKKYVNDEKAKELTSKLNNIFDNNASANAYETYLYSGEIYAQISVETFVLIQNLYPNGLEKEKVPVVAGLLAHVFMSLDRWRHENFIEVPDFEDIKKQNYKVYIEIEEYLKRVSKILNIYIDPAESIAILRYIIYE